jgi:cytochrome c-type biogenesis protein CcmH
MLPAPALAQPSSSLHSGTVHIEDARERLVFGSLRCMCGGCERLLLTVCACPVADDAREMIRKKIAAGETNDQIILAYQNEYGTDALAIPPNKGGMQAIYAVPLVAIGAGAIGVVVLVRRWSKTPKEKKRAKKKSAQTPERDALDDRLDAELRDLDD